MPFLIPLVADAFVAIGIGGGGGAAAAGLSTGLISAMGAAEAGGAVAATGALGGVLAASGITAFAQSLAAGSLASWLKVGLVAFTIAGLFIGRKQPQSMGNQLNLKLNPDAPLPIVFGRTATAGNLVFRESFNKNNVTLAMVTVLSVGGPIESIEKLIVNNYDMLYDPTPTGNGMSLPSGIFAGGANLYSSGSQLYFANYQSWQLGNQPEEYYTMNTGANPLESNVVGAHPPNWDASCIGNGIASTLTLLNFASVNWPGGAVPPQIYVVNGTKCYDPRFDSTQAGGDGPHRYDDYTTYTFTENPAIQGVNWLLGRNMNGAKVWGIGANFFEIDFPAWMAFANNCDANSWFGGGVVQTDDDKFQVLTTICQAGAGQPINKNGLISVIYGAPKTSLWEIFPADVVGTTTVQNTSAWRDRKNQILGTYREETQFWTMIPGNLITDDVFLEEDGGEFRTLQQTYPMIQDATQLQQIASLDLYNTREFLSFTLACSPRLLNCKVGDCATLHLPEMGANGQMVLCISRSFDPTNFIVNLSFVSETTEKYADALGQIANAAITPTLTAFDPSVGDLPDSAAWSITGTVINSNSVAAADGLANGTSIPALIVEGACDSPQAASVNCLYRPYGQTTWASFSSQAANTTAMQFVIQPLIMGGQYEVGISYTSIIDVTGPILILDPDPATAGLDTAAFIVGQGGLATSNFVTWSGGFDGGVTGIPPALDINANGLLFASAIQYLDHTVEEALDQVNSDIANAVLIVNAAVVAQSVVQAAQAASDASNAVVLADEAVSLASNATGLLSDTMNVANSASANSATALSDLIAVIANVSTLQNTAVVLKANAVGSNAALASYQAAQASNNASFSGTLTLLTANVAGANSTITSLLASQAANNTVVTNELNILTANAAGANAVIVSDRVAQASNNSVFAVEINSLSTAANGVASTILADRISQASNNTAFTASIQTLTANAAGANAAITSLLAAQAANNSVILTDITVLNANAAGANSSITSLLAAQSSNNATFSTEITTLNANVAGANATITALKIAQAANNSVYTAEISTLNANASGANATITTLLAAQSANNTATTSQINTLIANVVGANSTISTTLINQASNNSTFASEISALSATSNGTTATLNNVQSVLASTWGATNLLLQSQTFSAGSWANDNSTFVVTNAVTAPDGTTTAYKLLGSNTNTSHDMYQLPVGVANTTAYTYSVHLKAADYNYAQLLVENVVANTGARCNVDLTGALAPTITLFGGSGLSVNVANVGSGWYRASISSVSPVLVGVAICNSFGSSTFVSNSAAGIYVWGAQLQTGSVATTYIPTANTSVSLPSTPTLSSQITTLTASTANTSAAVNANAAALATLTGQAYGSYTLTASANGVVAGMQILAANGPINFSTVIFNAANFQINNPSNTLNLFNVVSGVNYLANVSINGNLLISESVTAAQIAASTITADKLSVTDLSAISANLGSIVVGTANIGNLVVGTSNIAGSAVSNIVTAFSPTVVNQGSVSVTVAATGGIININGQAIYASGNIIGNSPNNSINLYRDGVLILGPLPATYQAIFVWSDAPAAGTHTYMLKMLGGTANFQNLFIQATELKK